MYALNEALNATEHIVQSQRLQFLSSKQSCDTRLYHVRQASLATSQCDPPMQMLKHLSMAANPDDDPIS
jgi:hypothetical protein